MTRQEALGVWAILTAAAPGHDLDEDQLAIRAELIIDLDFAAARAAAIRLAQTARWVPSVAEFREAVLGGDLLTIDELIAELFAVAAGGVIRYGNMPPLSEITRPEVNALAEALGGWERVGTEDVEVVRAHAVRLAGSVIERHRRQVLAGPPAQQEIDLRGERKLVLPDKRIPE